MTKRDYIAIAEVLRTTRQDAIDVGLLAVNVQTSTIWVIANRLAKVLENDNPRFDRQEFLTACGL